MGQATKGLYSLLGSKCRGIRLREWKGGELSSASPPSVFPGLERYGNYLVLTGGHVPALWGALYSAVTQQHPLVVLPPSSAMEKDVLLGQLPKNPPANAVLALFTSGTTGEPKAVFHSEKGLLTSAEQLAKAFPGNAPTCSLLSPWGMAGVMFHCLLPAMRGSDVIFSASNLSDWAGEAGELFAREKVELVTLNPFLLEMWLRMGGTGAWAGKAVSLTAPLKEAQKVEFRSESKAELLEIYGMTEAAGPVLLEGKSLGSELRLSDSGELEIHGEQMLLGYGHAGEFREAGPWFSTGDIFEQREDSTFVHLSRARELIDLGGRKVAPRMIEAAFESMEELADCLAFGKEIAGVERVALVYVRQAGCPLSEEQLSAKVEARAKELLSRELWPHWWREMKQVPRSVNGKPDRRKLREL